MTRLIGLYREAFSGLPRAVWALAAVTLINRMGTMVVPFLALWFTKDRGYDTADAGLMIATFGLGGVVGSWAGGWFSDRIGPARTQAASLVLSAIGLPLLGQMESAAALAGMCFVLAVVTEAFRPANSATLAALCAPEIRTRAFALNRLAINAGMSVGPAVGGFLAEIDYQLLFWIDAATCLAAAFMVMRLFGGMGRPEPTLDEHGALVTGRSPWRDAGLLAVIGLTFLVGCIFLQAFSTLMVHFDQGYGFSEHVIGLVMAVNTVIIVVVEMILIKRVESRNPLAVVAVGSFLTGLGFALLPYGIGVAWAVFTVVVWTFGEMLTAPVAVAWVANRAQDSNRGRYLAAMNLAFAAGMVVAPWAGTLVYEHLGSDALWHACGVLGVVSALGFWAMGRR